MEKAVFINSVKQIARTAGFDRLYYGAEFCQDLTPSLNDVKNVVSAAEKQGKAFTLLTSYVTGEGLKRLRPLFEYLNARDGRMEVVCNEWGVFRVLRREYRNIRPVLGRLLTKQRRDPRMYNILLNRQKPQWVFDERNRKKVLVLPKKVPAALLEHYQGSVINLPAFQDFLLSHDVQRVEIDHLPWDMTVATGRKIQVSVYGPYAYMATTRLCGTINLTSGACGKECRKRYFRLERLASPLPIYVWGNTVFYKAIMPEEKYLKERGIDRIVRNDRAPV